MAIALGVHVALDHLDAVAIDLDDGETIAAARRDYPGERDDIAEACDDALSSLRASLGARGRHVACIGLSGDPAGVAVDADGIISSIPISASRAGDTPVWCWIREHDDAAWSRATTLLTIKDALGLYLCGERGSDDTSAVAMRLFDGAARRWSAAALDAAQIPHKLMPQVGAPTERLGRLLPERANRLGLAAGTPVMRGATTTVARAVAVGAVEPGRALLVTGEEAALTATTAAWIEHTDGAVRAMRHATPRLSALERSFACPTAALDWYERTLCDGERIAAEMRGSQLLDLLCEAASTVPPGAGGVLFVPDVRASLIGASAHASKADVSRAVLEGVTHALADVIAPLVALVATNGTRVTELRMSGPLGQRAFTRQLLADVTSLEICTTGLADSAAHGAALLAACGMADGDLRAVDGWVAVRHRTRPNPASQAKQAGAYAAYRALHEALEPRAALLDRIDFR